MGFLNLFGTMLAGAAITPIALLPPSCTVTTETNVPASTDIRTSTLTYNGPFPPGPFSAFEVSVTTYTVVVPTEGPGGEIQSQTYTFIASPIVEPVPPTSLPTSPPLETDVPGSTYIGCFKNMGIGGGPLLYGPSAVLDTQEACQAFCRSASGGPFKYFSTQPVSDCQCGQSFNRGGLQPGLCTTACTGNVTQECGGPEDDASVWEITPFFVPPPGPADRDPSYPGDGVDDGSKQHPGRPHHKPPSHGKKPPHPGKPTKYKPHPYNTVPPKSYKENYGYVDSGYPVTMLWE